jgi:hypothetical protein
VQKDDLSGCGAVLLAIFSVPFNQNLPRVSDDLLAVQHFFDIKVFGC